MSPGKPRDVSLYCVILLFTTHCHHCIVSLQEIQEYGRTDITIIIQVLPYISWFSLDFNMMLISIWWILRFVPIDNHCRWYSDILSCIWDSNFPICYNLFIRTMSTKPTTKSIMVEFFCNMRVLYEVFNFFNLFIDITRLYVWHNTFDYATQSR